MIGKKAYRVTCADTASLLSVPTRPDIGIAAISLLTICRGVAGARVNDRDISENAHADFLHREATDRHRSSGLCEKLFLVDERPVWVRAQEILGQDLVPIPAAANPRNSDSRPP